MTFTPELRTKSDFRIYAKKLISQYSDSDKIQVKTKVIHYIKELILQIRPSKVISYRSDSWEIDLFPLVQEYPHIEFYFPKVESNSDQPKLRFLSGELGWVKGSFGLWEPKESPEAKVLDPKDSDLIFLPGLAFNEKGFRLGRGAGFYDQNLRDVPQESIYAVIWESCSNLPFPNEAHDIRAFKCISEIGVRGFLD